MAVVKKGEKPAEEAPKAKPKKEKKSQKERPKSKKKHAIVQVWKLYDVKDGEAKPKKKFCPRCGRGTFLADHKNRSFCGKCRFSQIAVEKKK
ncbi:30S ribosomal protein S27ae [Candidatus Aenigmatarchaeota archaeon]